MVSIHRIEAECNMPICREYVNEQYRASLTPRDCIYGYPYAYKCPRRGKTKNIVTGFRLSGSLKLLMK